MNNSSKLETNESPYSSIYQISKDPYVTLNTTNKDDFANQKYSTSSDPIDFSKEDTLQNKFIDKAKEDMNILPTDYRNKINRINSLFVITSCIFPTYFLLNLLKNYPDVNQYTKRNLCFSTALYLGITLLLNNLSNKNYRSSYYYLRSHYSADQLRLMIDQYHEINRQSLSSSSLLENYGKRQDNSN